MTRSQRTAGSPGTTNAWRAFPDMKGTITNLVVSENQAVAEVMWEGTHKGELKTPFGVIPPSSTHNANRAILVLKVENDLIVQDRHYFDFLAILRQIGALPELMKKAAGA
jgi:predicted ester cyclase